jgi:uncharacterized membrane protein YfcA
MTSALVFLALGGILAGLLAGLLGVGGGIVLVPLFTLILPYLGITPNAIMHVAVATSMAVIAVTSFSSARVHWSQGQVIWLVFIALTMGTIPGTLTGVYLAHFLPGKGLHLIFGFFALAIAIQTLFDMQPNLQRELPTRAKLACAGFLVGVLCALLGMGGGMLIVPYLSRYRLTMHNVISTSALCTLPISIVGCLGFIAAGTQHHPLDTPWTTGYIYWPAFLAVAMAGVIFAPIGAKLAHRVPSHILKRIFGLFLTVVSLHMLLSGII